MSPADAKLNEALRQAEDALCAAWQALPEGAARDAITGAVMAVTNLRRVHAETNKETNA
jgi:hypothetical protein